MEQGFEPLFAPELAEVSLPLTCTGVTGAEQLGQHGFGGGRKTWLLLQSASCNCAAQGSFWLPLHVAVALSTWPHFYASTLTRDHVTGTSEERNLQAIQTWISATNGSKAGQREALVCWDCAVFPCFDMKNQCVGSPVGWKAVLHLCFLC